MTRDQLLDTMAKKAEISKRAAGDALGAMTEAVTKTLQKGDKLTLTGFGTFSISKRAARQGVNPKTGAKIKIPAMKVPKFKAGKALKEAVR